MLRCVERRQREHAGVHEACAKARDHRRRRGGELLDQCERLRLRRLRLGGGRETDRQHRERGDARGDHPRLGCVDRVAEGEIRPKRERGLREHHVDAHHFAARALPDREAHPALDRREHQRHNHASSHAREAPGPDIASEVERESRCREHRRACGIDADMAHARQQSRRDHSAHHEASRVRGRDQAE